MKPIGLFVLARSIIAFGAATAQAEPGAYWEVNGIKLEKGTTLLAEMQLKSDSAQGTFLTKVGTSTIEIVCNGIKFVGAKLHELGRATGKGHVEGCTTLLNGVQASRCTPKSPGAPATGLIETNALVGLIKLFELAGGTKDGLLELSPETGTAFVTLEMGSLCAIGNKFDITGKATMKDCQGEGLINKIEHLFEEGPGSALLFGSNAATIDGSAWGFLVGAHVGMTFSGHPA